MIYYERKWEKEVLVEFLFTNRSDQEIGIHIFQYNFLEETKL